MTLPEPPPAPSPRDQLISALARDINFALCHKVRLPMVGTRLARWKTEIDSYIAAQAIARQLVLTNWKFERGPPLKPHTSSDIEGPPKTT
jgi:hypothetical protein